MSSLSRAARAAERRRARKSGTDAAPARERAAATEAHLTITEDPALAELRVSIRFVTNGREAEDAELGDADLVLRDVSLRAYADGEGVHGHDTVRYAGETSGGGFLVEDLERALPVLRKLNRFLEMAVEESDDPSFAKAVDSLAAHLRVSGIVHVDRHGKETAGKRGRAYLMAHTIAEEFATRPRDEMRDAA